MGTLILTDTVMTKAIPAPDVLVGFCPDRMYCYISDKEGKRFYFNSTNHQ